MLANDVFVFDNVVHMYDLSDDNLLHPDNRIDRRWLLGLGEERRAPWQNQEYGDGFPIWGFAKTWEPHALAEMLIEQSSTDMAMAQAVVLYDVYKNGFAPVYAQHEFAKAYPDRVLFCGGVDPMYPSLAGALEEMERQVEEMGARSFKFYSAHLDGKSWRADDEALAYPLFEKGRELGIEVFQFHRGFPITRAKLEDLTPLDIQQPAMDFPDLTFAIHHLALPYFEEVVYMAARLENVHLVLSGTMQLPLIAPYQFNKYLGRLLRDVGSDRILYGSEAPLFGNPEPILKEFWNMSIDEELQERYGFPEITFEDKRKILGENMARLFGVDIDAKKKQLSHLGPAVTS